MKRVFKGGLIAVGLLLAFLIFRPAAQYEPYVPPLDYRNEAAQYLNEHLPPMPEDWAWQYVTAPDGAKMRTGRVEPTMPPKATVIYVPGYASILDIHAGLLSDLASRGYRVMGFDLRGQGGSHRMLTDNPEKPWIKSFAHYAEDLNAFIASDAVPRDVPVIVMGESMGGHVAVRMMGDHQTDIDGAVLLVPAFSLNTAPLPKPVFKGIVATANLLGSGKKYIPGSNNWRPWQPNLSLANPCSTDLSRAHLKDVLYASNPVLRVGGQTNKWIGEFMKSNKIIRKPKYLSQIETPVVIATANQDVIVKSPAAAKACETGLPNCQHVEIKARHCVTLEDNSIRASVLDAVDQMYNTISR